MSLVSNNIKVLRKRVGLTQEKLAARIGIKRSLLGAYEEARAEPRPEYLQAMAQVFGVHADALTKEDLSGFINPLVAQPQGVRIEIKPTPEPAPAAQNSNTNSNYQGATHAATPRPVHYTSAERQGQYVAPERQNQYAAPERPSQFMPSERSAAQPAPSPAQPASAPPQRPVAQEAPRQQNVAQAPASADYLEGKKMRVLSVTVDARNKENIEYVSGAVASRYASKLGDPEFLESLPRLSLPMLKEGELYRAFEAGSEIGMALPPGTTVIGRYIRNWYTLTDQQMYVLVTRSKGLLFTKLLNRIQDTGALVLINAATGLQEAKQPVEDVLEIWEASAYLQTRLPESDLSMQKLTQMVLELQQEVLKLKSERR